VKSKCQFWDGQQPKLREIFLFNVFSGRFCFSLTRRDYAASFRDAIAEFFTASSLSSGKSASRERLKF
jgi:hypothetical protein